MSDMRFVGYLSHIDDETGSLRLWPTDGVPPFECDPEAGHIIDLDAGFLGECGIVEPGQPVGVEEKDGALVVKSLGPAQGSVPHKIRDIDYTKFRNLNE